MKKLLIIIILLILTGCFLQQNIKAETNQSKVGGAGGAIMTFAEPGGDADFLVGTTNGFWGNFGGLGTIATDFVHGGHKKSIKYAANVSTGQTSPASSLVNTGSRISMYIYLVALPTSATAAIWRLYQANNALVCSLRLTSGGVIQLWNGANTLQIGTNGSTLSTGQWYRISLAYTITSTTVNRFEQFVNGVSSISITNATLTNVLPTFLDLGNINLDATLDFRSSDHYIDNSNALTDPGNIWVTAKRPFSNGTTNGFTTQIGSGGSGYGSGHSTQVNERPLSTTNGWSIVGAGSAVTEEYNIENAATGDINLTGATIVDVMGWASMSSLAGETVNMIIGGSSIAQAITSTATLYTTSTGATTYPAGAGADIGITTDTSLTTVSLYETGIIIAYIPPQAPTVTTQTVTSITDTAATGNGNVTSDGGATITERGVCWSTSSGCTTAGNHASTSGTTGAYTVAITGLYHNTTYYVKSYAINSAGTSYGNEVTFTTGSPSVIFNNNVIFKSNLIIK